MPPPDPAARLRSLEEAAANARTEAEVHKYDVRNALKQLEAEEARRVTAEAERKEWEELAHAFERDLHAATAEQAKLTAAVAAEAAKAPAVAEKAIVARATLATKATELDERSTRIIIDGQLRDAGWEVDSETLTWRSGARPEKGKNRAIAEVPTETADDGPGIADYVLFLGLLPCAVVEAKRKAKKIPSVIEQAKRYARGLTLPSDAANRAGEGAAPGWASSFTNKAPRYQVPFLYATNGRPYLRQLEIESGIWFQDVRHPTNHPRALLGWHAPEALAAMLAHDAAASDQKLRDKPPDVIQQALGLRDYQIRAIHDIEQAIAAGQRSLLLAMATGTGKTRTVIGLIHRLLESQRFRRVLFLVDRGALGKQAHDAFNEVRLENLMWA
jgi:type I restriction enzyme R subunit